MWPIFYSARFDKFFKSSLAHNRNLQLIWSSDCSNLWSGRGIPTLPFFLSFFLGAVSSLFLWLLNFEYLTFFLCYFPYSFQSQFVFKDVFSTDLLTSFNHLRRFESTPGPNPTIVSYNASVVKIYSTVGSQVRFEKKIYFEKRCSLLQRWRCCKFRRRKIGSM
jgi:hypothetical protein